MLKFLHLILNLCNIIHLLCSPRLLHIGIGIAEISPSVFLVSLIVSETKPTEFMLAGATSHVHASLILLDLNLTLGA